MVTQEASKVAKYLFGAAIALASVHYLGLQTSWMLLAALALILTVKITVVDRFTRGATDE